MGITISNITDKFRLKSKRLFYTQNSEVKENWIEYILDVLDLWHLASETSGCLNEVLHASVRVEYFFY